MKDFSLKTEIALDPLDEKVCLKMEIKPVFYKVWTSIERSLNDTEITLPPGYYGLATIDKKLEKEKKTLLGLIKVTDNRANLLYVIRNSCSRSKQELLSYLNEWVNQPEKVSNKEQLEIDFLSSVKITEPATATAG